MRGQCRDCGSWAINHHAHGRDGSDPDLCDVCYWRTRYDKLKGAARQTLAENLHLADGDECTLKVLRDAVYPEGMPESGAS
jgi:hypothetical protein